ncbi:hypothetical protein [Porphyrobacter sp. YT40]|uniref:hypothetical protein n=1 Tax=Porphyrobacter sp. YT40 TaxID=2547601 RepID=UPI001144A70A|nr:hypothetical protein [Porphyrobacter sp. YT40]QDH35548.1 hypothetical protein E2E27_15245 [Porphyrobacter sp. YT40]
MTAISAADHAPQWKVLIEVFAGDRIALGLEALLDQLESFEADKPLMLTLAQADIPLGEFQIP